MTLGARQIYQEPQKTALLTTDFLLVDDNTIAHDTWKITGQQVIDLVSASLGPYALFTYTEVTPPGVQIDSNTGYIVTGITLSTLTLPLVSNVGDVIEILNEGSNVFTIAQNASQIIQAGTNVTTTGAGGSLSCTNTGDALKLVCTVANTMWQVISATGNFSGV